MSVIFLAREQMSWTLLDASGGYEQVSATCLPGLADAARQNASTTISIKTTYFYVLG